MPALDDPQSPPNAYERAVCYYTIPKVIRPLTLALIVVYAVCLVEALVILVAGLLLDQPLTTAVGAWALGGIVAFGVLVFSWRTLSDEVRRRRALAEAQRPVPISEDPSTAPDPFATHMLLSYPADDSQTLVACAEVDGEIRYFVERAQHHMWWNVRSEHDEEICRIRALSGARSFSFGNALPSVLGVYKDEHHIATIQRRFGWLQPYTEIVDENGDSATVTARNQALYRNDTLLGRIYILRGAVYLDIDRDALTTPVLAYFVSLM